MHIGFLTSEYPPLPSGGIGTSVRNLGRALVRQGHRVTVIGWGREAHFCDEGVEVRMLGHTRVPRLGWLLNRRSVQRALNALVRDQGLDLVEAPDWCGLSAGMGLRCPLVIRCHGSATYFGHLLSEPVRRSVRWAEQLALHDATSVAAVSRFTGELTRQLFRLTDPVGVIPNGISLGQFQPAPQPATAPTAMLYLGSLVRKKGVLDLCRIFSQVIAQEPDARLLLVGRDVPDQQSGSPSTWALCRDLLSPAAATNTEYLGPQPYERVQDYVRQATVCVFPSYAEAMPLSWLEAMACGRPLVAYNIGWAPEVIEHGISGLLVPPGDIGAGAEAVLKLLSDRAEAERLSRAARQRVEQHFSADIVAKKSVQWYQQVLAEAR